MEPPPFTFSITTMFKDCLSRQIGEALRIQYSPDMILNSKSEYLDNCITRLTIEESQWERKEREKSEEMQEELLKTEVEKFKGMIEARRSTTELCQEIITNLVEIAIRDENQNYAVDNIPSERLEDEENLNLPEGCILETRPMETVQAGRPTDTSREMDVEDNLVVDTTEEGEHEPDYEAHSKMMNDVEQCQENGKLAVQQAGKSGESSSKGEEENAYF